MHIHMSTTSASGASMAKGRVGTPRWMWAWCMYKRITWMRGNRSEEVRLRKAASGPSQRRELTATPSVGASRAGAVAAAPAARSGGGASSLGAASPARTESICSLRTAASTSSRVAARPEGS
eukprot:scaffold3334_cov139-Isochrysis_galbana.AAC.4